MWSTGEEPVPSGRCSCKSSASSHSTPTSCENKFSHVVRRVPDRTAQCGHSACVARSVCCWSAPADGFLVFRGCAGVESEAFQHHVADSDDGVVGGRVALRQNGVRGGSAKRRGKRPSISSSSVRFGRLRGQDPWTRVHPECRAEHSRRTGDPRSMVAPPATLATSSRSEYAHGSRKRSGGSKTIDGGRKVRYIGRQRNRAWFKIEAAAYQPHPNHCPRHRHRLTDVGDRGGQNDQNDIEGQNRQRGNRRRPNCRLQATASHDPNFSTLFDDP